MFSNFFLYPIGHLTHPPPSKVFLDFFIFFYLHGPLENMFYDVFKQCSVCKCRKVYIPYFMMKWLLHCRWCSFMTEATIQAVNNIELARNRVFKPCCSSMWQVSHSLIILRGHRIEPVSVVGTDSELETVKKCTPLYGQPSWWGGWYDDGKEEKPSQDKGKVKNKCVGECLSLV